MQQQQYEALKAELTRFRNLNLEEAHLPLSVFSGSRLYAFLEESSRELAREPGPELVALQLWVIGVLEQCAERDLSDRGGERIRLLAMLQLYTDAWLEASHEGTAWQLRQLETLSKLRGFYKP